MKDFFTTDYQCFIPNSAPMSYMEGRGGPFTTRGVYLLLTGISFLSRFLRSSQRFSSKMTDDDLLAGLDDIQVKLLNEECILVDRGDSRIGTASKKVCHQLTNINQGISQFF